MPPAAENGNWTPELMAQLMRFAGEHDPVARAEADRLEAEIAPEPGPPPLLPIAVSPPELTLVHDADANNRLACDVEAIGALAMARIKETLSKPFDPGDPHYQQLLKFTASIYGSTMNTLLRADENRLKQRAVDRLPELLAKVAEQERLRDARRTTIEGTTVAPTPGEGPDAA
jgi:hypothetical protein